MNSPPSGSTGLRAQRIALVAAGAMVVLQLAWHGWFVPPLRSTPLIAAGLATLPWLLVLAASVRNQARGVLWGGTLALFYFAHGVAVAWSGAGILRALAWAEIVLSLLVILPPGMWAWRVRRKLRSAGR